MKLPRIFVIRHGETEWSLSGQHTGKSDIPLTAHGEQLIRELGPKVNQTTLNPDHIRLALVSPRQRAQKTYELIFESNGKYPEKKTDDRVQEWDYGLYDGKTAETIRATLDPTWNIWADGCPEGESPQQMQARIDGLIDYLLKETEAYYRLPESEKKYGNGDICIFSHGHFTRCFLARWCKLEMAQGALFVSDPGSISVCTYYHNNFDERCVSGVNLYGQF